MKQPKKPLSIGFLYDDTLDSYDGVAQYVKTLGGWLSARGHNVCYLVGETKLRHYRGSRIYSLAKNKSVIFNGNRLSIPVLANRGQIKEALSTEQLDVVHVQVPYSPLMSQIVINQAAGSSVIIGTYHIYPSKFSAEVGAYLLRLLIGRSLKKFDQIISVSPPAAEFARRSFKIDTDVVPNVVDVAHFQPKKTLNTARNEYHIVFLGRLVKRKGCLSLLKAFALLQQLVPNVRLSIAGEGPQRRLLEDFTKQKNLGSAVTFLGFITEEDKPKLLATADVACFPALYGESFGIVLIEAMAAGAKVVLGGNNPGYSAVLGEQPQLLINPIDTEVFAARLAEMLQDKQLAAKLHKWQLSEVKKYDVAKVGPQIEALYYRAIANHSKSRHN